MKRVAVTGAGGQVAYALVGAIARGEMFGAGVEVALNLLDVPEALPMVRGLVMELEDGAYPWLREIVVASSHDEVFDGADWAVLIGAKPRGAGMERRDLLGANGAIFAEQGSSLASTAPKGCSVLVVGNPCNTNALIIRHKAPHLKVAAMSRLDQNRATSLLARKAKVSVGKVSRVAVWGNHSATLVPDVRHARIDGRAASQAVDAKWLETEFVGAVQQRGAEVIRARGKSSALSAANAIVDCVHDVVHPTEWFSLGIDTLGNPYGIAPDLMFSMPCRSKSGAWDRFDGLDLQDPGFQQRLRVTERELIEERDLVRHLL